MSSGRTWMSSVTQTHHGRVQARPTKTSLIKHNGPARATVAVTDFYCCKQEVTIRWHLADVVEKLHANHFTAA